MRLPRRQRRWGRCHLRKTASTSTLLLMATYRPPTETKETEKWTPMNTFVFSLSRDSAGPRTPWPPWRGGGLRFGGGAVTARVSVVCVGPDRELRTTQRERIGLPTKYRPQPARILTQCHTPGSDSIRGLSRDNLTARLRMHPAK